MFKLRIFCLLLSPFLFSACQVVSVKNQAVNVSIANERDSILTRKKMSEASLNVLSMTGSEGKTCTEQPDACVEGLEKFPQIIDEEFLSTASEIYLSKALALGESSACKRSSLTQYRNTESQNLAEKDFQNCMKEHLALLDQSIRYSYAYLFMTDRQPSERIFDNRQVQIRDFYNQALAKMVSSYSQTLNDHHAPLQLNIGKSNYQIDYTLFPMLQNKEVQSFISTYNLNFSGLRSINRRDGFGAEFVAILKQPEAKREDRYVIDPLNHRYANGSNPNIHQSNYIPVTLIAEPKDQQSSVEEILHGAPFTIRIFDPLNVEKVQVAKRPFSLAANFSAPYGLWLAQNNLGTSAYLSLIDRDNTLIMPHLYMMEPYNPNKKVIVLVHGLASSPEAWIRLTNDIMGDQVLRENYQTWQVFYSTNMPILESRFQIDAIIRQAFQITDPNTSASQDAVLIGHSMGGIISRLLVSQADLKPAALNMMSMRDASKIKKNPVFAKRLEIQPIPNFGRAIFLAAPHRGTAFADRWFTKAARRIIKLPVAFLGAIADSVDDKEIDIKHFMSQVGTGVIQNGPSDLSHNSKFTQLTSNVLPAHSFKYHSIMGNVTSSHDPELMTDGIVPYRSAHLDAALSERIFKGGHSIQETPESVLELRRILNLHLQQTTATLP